MIKMSTSSNSSFTGVSNEIYGRINSGNVSSATVSAGTVKTGSLSCERLDYPGDFPSSAITLFTAGAPDVTLTDANITIISNKGILFIVSGGLGAAGSINVGPDTSARAAALLTLFNISDAVPSRLIRVTLLNKNPAHMISIKNSSSGPTSQTFVQFNTFTSNTTTLGTPTNTLPLVDGNATMDGYILVSKGSVVANSSTILFTIIGKATG
jgi:hypothetical protein